MLWNYCSYYIFGIHEHVIMLVMFLWIRACAFDLWFSLLFHLVWDAAAAKICIFPASIFSHRFFSSSSICCCKDWRAQNGTIKKTKYKEPSYHCNTVHKFYFYLLLHLFKWVCYSKAFDLQLYSRSKCISPWFLPCLVAAFVIVLSGPDVIAMSGQRVARHFANKQRNQICFSNLHSVPLVPFC